VKTRIKKSGKKVVQEREIEIEREQKIMRKRERESRLDKIETEEKETQ
jgi:hypothetical protein